MTRFLELVMTWCLTMESVDGMGGIALERGTITHIRRLCQYTDSF
jgi:hypothetical protein